MKSDMIMQLDMSRHMIIQTPKYHHCDILFGDVLTANTTQISLCMVCTRIIVHWISGQRDIS